MRRENGPSGPRFFNIRVNFQAFADEIEDFLASRAAFGRRDEHRRQLLPCLRKPFPVALHALFALGFRELVGFGEDDAERYAVFAQHVDEPEVDALGLEADVRQHEQEVHLPAAEHVVGDERREPVAHGLRRAGVAVAGQVHQIPCVVDAEVVDEPRLAGRSRDFGQPRAAGEHVDERRFADVAAPDEGDVAQPVLRDLRDAFGTASEFGFRDFHRAGVFSVRAGRFAPGRRGGVCAKVVQSARTAKFTAVLSPHFRSAGGLPFVAAGPFRSLLHRICSVRTEKHFWP